jgi:hypothetical protein
MRVTYHNKNLRLICTIICMSAFLCVSWAQSTPSPETLLPVDLHRSTVMTSFFEREDVIGSPYLSKGWMQGVAEMSNHKIIPERDEPLLFNFDKINGSLFVVNRSDKIKFYPIDSVSSFELSENGTSYSFEKVLWIGMGFFLMPVIKSPKGYSLYKRLFTKLLRADYSSEGYYTKGKKSDEYIDYYEYYLAFPGNSSFKKLYLKENVIRRVLKDESVLLAEFFSMHDNEITEQSLLGIIQFINDRKYPD